MVFIESTKNTPAQLSSTNVACFASKTSQIASPSKRLLCLMSTSVAALYFGPDNCAFTVL
jgi:hypothetical protein